MNKRLVGPQDVKEKRNNNNNNNNNNKEKFGSHTRKTFNTFTTKDSCTWNITRNTESTAV
jgi:hypothetical protein